jgi:nitrite reductase (NADH) large subunit
MSTKLKLLGVDVGSIGDAHGRTPGALSYRFTDEHEGIYKKLVVSADGRSCWARCWWATVSLYDSLLQYCLNGSSCPPNPCR